MQKLRVLQIYVCWALSSTENNENGLKSEKKTFLVLFGVFSKASKRVLLIPHLSPPPHTHTQTHEFLLVPQVPVYSWITPTRGQENQVQRLKKRTWEPRQLIYIWFILITIKCFNPPFWLRVWPRWSDLTSQAILWGIPAAGLWPRW